MSVSWWRRLPLFPASILTVAALLPACFDFPAEILEQARARDVGQQVKPDAAVPSDHRLLDDSRVIADSTPDAGDQRLDGKADQADQLIIPQADLLVDLLVDQPPVPPLDQTTNCPSACINNCNGGICLLDCTNDCTCPSGRTCKIECTGPTLCGGNIYCGAAAACEIKCSGKNQCTGTIFCGSSDCIVNCDKDACSGNIECSGSCDISCDKKSCSGNIDCEQACSCKVACDKCQPQCPADCEDGCTPDDGCDDACES